MPLTLSWEEVALRLALTVVAGSLIGLNRSEGGHSAGLRTTLLVCLAASVSMIQVNLLLTLKGKSPESFAVLDLMRLPLGILTGMGFIGGGAILRRGNSVHGVTTAATLWLVTVIGLCLGGGQLRLGTAVTVLALVILWVLKQLEANLSRVQHARLAVVLDPEGPPDEELRGMLVEAGLEITAWTIELARRADGFVRTIRCELHWRARPADLRTPSVIDRIALSTGVRALRWKV
jgi:putative Mg2+ transporter-C (MgtC) family protein